jgi:hypothetical protein
MMVRMDQKIALNSAIGSILLSRALLSGGAQRSGAQPQRRHQLQTAADLRR